MKLSPKLHFTKKQVSIWQIKYFFIPFSSFLFLLSYVSPNRTNNGKEMWGPHTHTHTHTQPFLDSDKWWRGGVNHSGFRLNSRSRNSCSGSPPYSLADKRGRQAILLYSMHTRGAREVGKKVGIKFLRLWEEEGEAPRWRCKRAKMGITLFEVSNTDWYLTKLSMRVEHQKCKKVDTRSHCWTEKVDITTWRSRSEQKVNSNLHNCSLKMDANPSCMNQQVSC